MDHAEVRAWLEQAFFEPGLLRRLELGDRSLAAPEGLLEHLAGCANCAGDLRELRATAVALDVSFGPSPGVEERLLSRLREVGRPRVHQPATSQGRLPGAVGGLSVVPLAAGLALVLVALSVGALMGLNWRSEPAGPRLAGATAAMGELLRAPDTQHLWLRDPAGRQAGLVVFSAGENRLAVIATGLAQADGQDYHCFVERDGQRTWIGPMHLEAGTSFWAGPMPEEVDAGQPGDRFLVLAEATGEPLLSGEFQ